MKENLVLQSTSLAQWHALVEEARQSSSIVLSEDLESYLVFLLMRFTKEPNLANSLLAFDFLQNIKKHRSENLQILRDVGDKCLLFAGLFPGRAKKRRVQISYYVELGQSAYSSLSESHQSQLSPLFGQLCHHFVGLMDVLHAIRELDPKAYTLDLLEAEELWRAGNSKHAQKVLKHATNGTFISEYSLNPLQKH